MGNGGNIFKHLLTLGCLILISTFVYASEEIATKTTLEDRGYKSNQPFGIMPKAGVFESPLEKALEAPTASVPSINSVDTVNEYSGNLIIAAKDLAFPGRGVDVDLTRYYNSNLWISAELDGDLPRKDALHKPSWLGYGWDMHFGRIKMPLTSCPETLNDISHYYVEWADGSKQPFIRIQKDDISDLSTPYPAEYILPDFSKVTFYTEARENDADYSGQTGYEDLDFKEEYTQTWFIITKPDGTKYIFTHHVDLYAPELTSNCNYDMENFGNYWTDYDQSNSQFQRYMYTGVYLTRIEDVNGNFIEVGYWDQTDIPLADLYSYNGNPSLNPTRSPEMFSGSAWGYGMTTGSPYPKNLTDTVGREIYFHLDRWDGSTRYVTEDNENGEGDDSDPLDEVVRHQSARLDYIKYKGIGDELNPATTPAYNDEWHYVDYVYWGDKFYYLDSSQTLQSDYLSTPNMGCSTQLKNEGICDDRKFLASVQYKDDDLDSAPLTTVVKYQYDTSTNYQIVKVRQDNDPDIDDGYVFGSETIYSFGNIKIKLEDEICTLDLCNIDRRVIVAKTVCDNPGTCYAAAAKYPALTTFYMYDILIDNKNPDIGINSNEFPPGYMKEDELHLPLAYTLTQGPYKGYTTTTGADRNSDGKYDHEDVIDYLWNLEEDTTQEQEDNYLVRPFVATISQYSTIAPHVRTGFLKDGILLAKYTYDNWKPFWNFIDEDDYGMFYTNPRSLNANIREGVSYFYKSFGELGGDSTPLGIIHSHYTSPPGTDIDHNYYKLVKWGELRYEKSKDTGNTEAVTFSYVKEFDDFANPKETVDYGRVALATWTSTETGLFRFYTGCTGASSGISHFEEATGGCHWQGVFMDPNNATHETDELTDVQFNRNNDDYDDEKTITRITYAHEIDDHYLGRPEPIFVMGTEETATPVLEHLPHWIYTPCDGTGTGEMHLEEDICKSFPFPYIGAPFQRINLPYKVETYAEESDGSGEKLLSKDEYRYDSTPLIGDSYRVFHIYDGYHHRGFAHVGWPFFTFMDEGNDINEWIMRSYRGLLTESTQYIYDPQAPGVSSTRSNSNFYDVAGRLIINQNAVGDETVYLYRDSNDVSGLDELLYCIDDPYDERSMGPGANYKICQNIWLSSSAFTAMYNANVLGPMSISGDFSDSSYGNWEAYPIGGQGNPPSDQHPKPLISSRAAGYLFDPYPYVTEVVHKPKPEIFDRVAWDFAFPYYGYGIEYEIGDYPTITTFTHLDDISQEVAYLEETGQVDKQWTDGPGVSNEDLNFIDYRYDSLGRLTKVLRKNNVGTLESTSSPSLEITYRDFQSPREVETKIKHTSAGGYLNPTTARYDPLGRNYASYTLLDDSGGSGPYEYVYSLKEYDEKGNVEKIYRPYEVSLSSAPMDESDEPTPPDATIYQNVETRIHGDLITESNVMQVSPNTEILPTREIQYSIDWTKSKTTIDSSTDIWTKVIRNELGQIIKIISGADTATNADSDDSTSGKSTNERKSVEYSFDVFRNKKETLVVDYSSEIADQEFVTSIYQSSIEEPYRVVSPDIRSNLIIRDGEGRVRVVKNQKTDNGWMTENKIMDGLGRTTFQYLGPSPESIVTSDGEREARYYHTEYGSGYGLGQITKIQGPNGQISYTFDRWGRVTKETKLNNAYPNKEQIIDYTYSWDGAITYVRSTIEDLGSSAEDGYEFNYEYDDLGRMDVVGIATWDGNTLSNFNNMVDTVVYNARGLISEFIQDPGTVAVKVEYEYYDDEAAEYLKVIRVEEATSGDDIFEQAFAYDDQGNVVNLYENDVVGTEIVLTSTDEIAALTYDRQNRLTDVDDKTTSNTYFGADLQFVYDDLGNREEITYDLSSGSDPVIAPTYLTTCFESNGYDYPAPEGVCQSGHVKRPSSRISEDKNYYYDYDRIGNLATRTLKFTDGDFNDAVAFTSTEWGGWKRSDTTYVSKNTADELELQGDGDGFEEDGSTTMWAKQRFKLDVGKTYKITYDAKVNRFINNAYINLRSECFNYDNGPKGTCSIRDDGTGRRLGHGSGTIGTNSGQWKDFTFYVTPDNEDEAHIQLVCELVHIGAGPPYLTFSEDYGYCDNVVVSEPELAYTYDASNKLVQITADDFCTLYYYDESGNRIRTVDKKRDTDGTTDVISTTYYYIGDKVHRKVRSTLGSSDVDCDLGDPFASPQVDPPACGSGSNPPQYGCCGNGIVESGEVCDGTNIQHLTCGDLGSTYEGTITCNNDCTAIDDTDCDAPTCGDGIMHYTEECEFMDLNCDWVDDEFVCPGESGEGPPTNGCRFEGSNWVCYSDPDPAARERFYNLDYFRGWRYDGPSVVDFLDIPIYSDENGALTSCYTYNTEFDSGELEGEVTVGETTYDVIGCFFPNENGIGGCKVRYWGNPITCKCTENCNCCASSPIFSKGALEGIPDEVLEGCSSPYGCSSPIFSKEFPDQLDE